MMFYNVLDILFSYMKCVGVYTYVWWSILWSCWRLMSIYVCVVLWCTCCDVLVCIGGL